MSLTDTLEHLPERLQPAKAANLLLYTIAGFVLLFVAWAAFFRVDEVSRAEGRVIPSRQLQIVQNLEGGIVREILVRQGDRVQRGQVLLRLDPTQFSAEFLTGQEGYNALVARITRLQSEVDGTVPQFNPGLVRAAPDLVTAERSLYEARRHDLAASLAVAEAKLDQARRALGQAQVETATKAQARALAERELSLLTPLVEKGIEPQIELLRAQSRVSETTGDYNAAQLGAERASAAVSEAQYEVQSVRERFRAKSVEDLTAAKAELAGMGRELPALQDKVRRTEVRAPIGGTVNRVLVTTVGGVVKPGEPLVEIVPRDDTLVVEARVKPSDIAFIHPGQQALVKLTAYDFSIYGGLEGQVERISSDAVENEKTGESYYLVRVRTDEATLLAADGSRLPITPGMIAEVDMLGDKRSILSYILSPLQKVGNRALRER